MSAGKKNGYFVIDFTVIGQHVSIKRLSVVALTRYRSSAIIYDTLSQDIPIDGST